MNSNFQLVLTTQPYVATLSYNDISSCPLYPMMIIQLYPIMSNDNTIVLSTMSNGHETILLITLLHYAISKAST
jgi:hypothetical protein